MQKNMQREKKKNNSKSGSRPAKSGNGMIQRPIAISKVNKWSAPRVQAGNNTIVISHREFLNDVVSGGGTFSCNSVSINPGLASVFPWLSHIAQNYESYRFRKLIIEYVPIAPTTQEGTMMLAMDFDAADATPLTKAGIMSMQGAQSGPMWGPLKMDCLKANLMKMAESRYVRGGSLSANLDIKTYDVAKLNIATASAGVFVGACGELYLDYVVELITPQYNMADEAADDSAKIVPTVGVTKATPLGTTRTVTGNLPIEVIDANTIKFNEAGDYLLDFREVGTAFIANPAITFSAGNSLLTFLGNLVDAASNVMVTQAAIRIVEKGSRVYLEHNAGSTTVTALTLRIARYLYTLA